MNVLTVDNARKTFVAVAALDGVSFVLRRRELPEGVEGVLERRGDLAALA